jgi:hypothetical protein
MTTETESKKGSAATVEETPHPPRATEPTWAPPTMPAPVPTPTYPSAPRRGMGKLGRFIMGVAIVVGVALVVGVVADMSKNDPFGGGDGKAGGGRSKPEMTSPTEGMNQAERKLYRTGGFYDCDPIPRSSLMAGATAGITCDASGTGKNAVTERVQYFKFDDNPAMTDTYNGRLANLRASAAVTVTDEYGWCLTTMGLPCTWSDGRVAFYRKGDTVHAEWTYFPKKTFATAIRKDSNMNKLEALWREAGPE